MDDQSRVILVLGSGPNLGTALASTFAGSGYKVALAARSLTTSVTEEGLLNIQADLSDPQAVPQVFQKTVDTFGPPNVVVYNGDFRQNFKSSSMQKD